MGDLALPCAAVFTNMASPTANITGTGEWAEALVKARALVSKLTLEQKVLDLPGLSLDQPA